MSINNIANSVFPNTLSGLDSINVTDITINGVDVTTLFVPYTGATKNVDLNNKNLSAVNNVGTSSVVATGLTTTNTLKIDSVPAGTTSKYLAVNATGNVVEADITTKYVPYTGASAHVNLNAKNLSNVLTYSGTNLQVTSTETTSLLATGLAQLGTLRISSVPAGTQTSLIAVDSAGNVIIGTAPASTQLNLSPTVSPTLYYFPFITSSSAGVQTVYTDNAVITLTYDTATKTLSPYRLKIQNVPAGTQTSLLAIDSAGNVIQGTSTPPTTLLTTQTGLSQTYYPTFVSTNTTGNKSYYVPYPQTAGYNITYTTTGVLGDIGTLNIPQLVIDASVVLPSTATSFASTPLTTGSPIVYGLGIDANNLVKAYTVGAPNVTVTNTNATYYPVFVATTMTSGVKDLYQDTTGNDFNYNPSTNLLTVSNLTVSGTTTISGYAPLASPSFTGTPTAPTAVSGTNTTQIATTAFVQTAIGGVSGYLPLTGGTMTGSISFASGVSTLLRAYYNGFVQYTYNISDNNGNNYISYTTDAPSATPVPLVGYIVLNRTTSINGQITSSSNASFGGTTISTGKITGNAGLTITNGGVTYANIGLNGINTLNGDTSFFSTAGNAVMQVSYGSGVNQNISATASYNWQTTSGGIGTTRMNIDVNRVKVSTIELAVSSQTYGQLRMIWSETGYGTFWRNDDANFYLLITANGDPYGIWNSLRPFYINLASGRLYSTNGQTFSNGTDTDYLTFQNGLGLTTASGATFGNVSVYGTGINGWNGYDLNKRWTLMAWSGNTEAGFIDNQVSWIWRTTGNNFHLDRPYIYFNNVPQQNYSPNQVLIGSNGNSVQWGVVYSTYYKNNNIQWQYGTVVATFYKASATAYLRASGAASYYVSSSQMNWTLVRFRNTTYGGDYDYYLNQFTNNPNNHVSFPIMAQAGGLPVGSYQVILYTAGNTDGNDHLYILSEICFA